MGIKLHSEEDYWKPNYAKQKEFSPWQTIIKGGVGLGGKLLMGAADSFTGGLASKILDASAGGLTKHAGVIGSVARGLGESYLSDKTRNRLANLADTALKYVPEGNVKTALSSINKSAKGDSVGAPLEKPTFSSNSLKESEFTTNNHARTYI